MMIKLLPLVVFILICAGICLICQIKFRLRVRWSTGVSKWQRLLAMFGYIGLYVSLGELVTLILVAIII